MNNKMLFLPVPRNIKTTDKKLYLENSRFIQIVSPEPPKMLFSAQRVQSALKTLAGVEWPIRVGLATPDDMVGIRLEIDTERKFNKQGYSLRITGDRILIVSQTEAGLFYGACTLIQLLEQYGRNLPCLEVDDWPDFLVRGAMLDISRDKVPSMTTLYDLVDRLASWKINQLQLYTEHTFAYLNHPVVWQNASPMTGQEILELDTYCRQRQIELVANQNSFGHMERWLKHPQYASLAEIHGKFDAPWGKVQGPFSLSPANPGSLELVKSLYDELLPHFSSRTVNVGCDETFDIGVGQSKEMCAARGADRVMLDYLLELYKDVKDRGFTMQYWADILVHHPYLLSEAPEDGIALIWSYEGSQSFEEVAASFEQANLNYYICPGTSSWNSIGGRTQNMLENTQDAARCGLAHKAIGYLNTDWGDNGHWQMLPVSWPGFAAGAAYSWCLNSNQNTPIESSLSQFAFGDENGSIGSALMRLGKVYQSTGVDIPNSSAIFWILRYSLDELRNLGTIGVEQLKKCEAEIEEAVNELGAARTNRPDAELFFREIHLTARMMYHACQRGLLLNEQDPDTQAEMAGDLLEDAADWLEEYRQIWLERNRPGGLADSVKNLDRLLQEYRAIKQRST